MLDKVASSAFLARELTPPDGELILGLAECAWARDEERLIIRDDETCGRLGCEPAPTPAEPTLPSVRFNLQSVA